ncbi:ATP-binding cassette domain-containing protein [Candidatus Dojkabacteria bacterium]|nr:ATP-binding cassette domain-containing protein [Candidatus Dojkabacteria bacterium]
MVSFKKVTKIYEPDIVALNNVSFEIEDGEFMFIVGPSGAGKSTLIRLLIRQELPTEGDILFDDIDVAKISKKMLPVFRQHIGVVFQDYKLLDTKTVRENIEFALEITGKPDEEIQDTTERLLEVVRLSDRDYLFPPQLSGGEKQRAGIARALANDPSFLIADEPTGNLDPQTSFEIIDILENINSWGTTIMIATHDKEIVDMMQKRVVRLVDGAIESDQEGSYDGTQKTSKQRKRSPIRSNGDSPKDERLKESPSNNKIDTTPLSDLDISKKILKRLNKSSINTIGDLLDLSESDLDNIKGIDQKEIQNITQKLEEFLKDGKK